MSWVTAARPRPSGVTRDARTELAEESLLPPRRSACLQLVMRSRFSYAVCAESSTSGLGAVALNGTVCPPDHTIGAVTERASAAGVTFLLHCRGCERWQGQLLPRPNTRQIIPELRFCSYAYDRV